MCLVGELLAEVRGLDALMSNLIQSDLLLRTAPQRQYLYSVVYGGTGRVSRLTGSASSSNQRATFDATCRRTFSRPSSKSGALSPQKSVKNFLPHFSSLRILAFPSPVRLGVWERRKLPQWNPAANNFVSGGGCSRLGSRRIFE